MQQQQKTQAKLNMPSDDCLLSQLPDDVLCHILFFLTTKHSVATSILSRRWRFLWTHVPTLNLDIKHRDELFWETDIIRKVLSLHKVQNLDTLRLLYRNNNDDSETWITNNIFARNTKHLYLFFDKLPKEIILPPLFKCKSLVLLDLCCCVVSTTTVSLPNLKALYLRCLFFDSDQSLPQLLSGCPILEELKIIHSGVRGTVHRIGLYISSPTIKHLTLANQPGDFRKVVVNAPALRTLNVTSTGELISFVELKSLIKAFVHLSFFDCDIPFDEDELYIYLLKVVDSLCNVKSLDLVTDHVEFYDIKLAESTFLMSSSVRFDNLMKLELRTHGLFLRRFLGMANNLEVLVYHEDNIENKKDRRYWKEPEQLPMCLTSRLRSITIGWFEFEEHSFEMIKYLLRNGKVLEKMEIQCSEPSELEEKFNEVQMISSFPRGSAACELELV